MRSNTTFKLFHGILILFYLVMFSTSVFHLDYKWNLPFTHSQFGIGFVLVITVFMLFNGKTLFRKLKHFLDFSKGKFEMKIFKLSVVLLMLHFVMSIISGIMMNFGVNTYTFHVLSKYLVPVFIIFHLITHVLKKYRIRNR